MKKRYDLTNDEYIYWDKKRKLTWNDFKGNPNPENPHTASSAIGLKFDYEFEYDERKTKTKIIFKDIFVKSTFTSSLSWVRQERIDTDLKSSTLLNHEQGHFDLAHKFSLTVQEKIREQL